MIDIFEFLIKDKFSEEALKDAFADYFSISVNNVVSDNDFFDQFDTKDSLVGLWIQDYREDGYKMIVSGNTNISCSWKELTDFALKTATYLNTEIVVDEYRKGTSGDALIFFPNGDIYEAYECNGAEHYGFSLMKKITEDEL